MTTRLLPSSEWSRLAAIDPIYTRLNPATSTIVVVEREGEIAACWALIQVLHVEGVWIAPAYRKSGSVARRLWQGMRRLVASCGATAVMTAAVTSEVRDLILAHGGVVLPGEHFCLSMEDRCRQSS